MKHILITLLIIVSINTTTHAQDGESGYTFLDIPASAHSAALGGSNISIIEDDATLTFTNAALLPNVTDRTLSLGYTTYIASSKLMSAAFVKAHGQRGTWAIAAQALNYGKETMTDDIGNNIGNFNMSDINIQATYAYLLTDKWTGAATAKLITSHYSEYSSTAIGTDLALNYYNDQQQLSLSITARNLGGQIDPLFDTKQTLPFNLAIGISKQLANAPIRFSLTANDITHSNIKFIEHFIIGADILPSHNTWIAVGYNLRRAREMEITKKSHGAGLSIGAGLNTKRIKAGVAYAKYHVAASSLIMNLSFSL